MFFWAKTLFVQGYKLIVTQLQIATLLPLPSKIKIKKKTNLWYFDIKGRNIQPAVRQPEKWHDNCYSAVLNWYQKDFASLPDLCHGQTLLWVFAWFIFTWNNLFQEIFQISHWVGERVARAILLLLAASTYRLRWHWVLFSVNMLLTLFYPD